MKKLLNLSEKLSKYIIAAVLIIIPLLPKFPLFNVPGTYVAIRSEDILILLLSIILIPKFFVDFKVIWKDKLIRSFIIFFTATFISLICGYLITETVTLRLGFLHWARRLEYIIPFLAAYLLIPKEKLEESLHFYFKILILVVAIAFFYGLGQRYYHFPVIITQNEEYSKGIALRWTPGAHINSTFAGHYDLSGFLVLIMPILLGAVFSVKKIMSRLVIAIVSGMGLWLLISSISRTAQATYLLAMTITLLMLKKIKGWILVAVISLVCMFMSSGLDARFSQAIKVLYEHITTGKNFSYVSNFTAKAEEVDSTTIVTPRLVPSVVPTPTPPKVINDVSISIRYNVEWPRAIRAFVKNPILGTGYSSIDLATDNDYLRMLGETGILGILAFGLIFINVGKRYLRAFKLRQNFSDFEKSFIFGVFGGMVGTFATIMLIDLFEASKFAIMFWLLLGFTMNLIKYKANE